MGVFGVGRFSLLGRKGLIWLPKDTNRSLENYKLHSGNLTLAMEHGPFEDVFPIKNGDIPASYVRTYQRGTSLGVFPRGPREPGWRLAKGSKFGGPEDLGFQRFFLNFHPENWGRFPI